MAKRTSPARIKTHRIYTVYEAGEVLDRHRQTVIRWIKDKGLVADTSRKPWLIRGADLKGFLGVCRAARRVKLAPHHFYCLGCKMPQAPDGRFAEYSHRTSTSGMLTGLCPACGSLMYKAICRADLEVIRAKIEVSIQGANPGLVSPDVARSNVTSDRGAESNVKTRRR